MRLVPLLVALACGCTPWVNTIPLNRVQRQMEPRSMSSVDVYSSGPPARPHLDVAFLEANWPDDSPFNTERMVNMLRGKAAEMGCDGVVIGSMNTRSADYQIPFDFGDRTLHGTCIVYQDPPAAHAAAEAPPSRDIPRAATPEIFKDLDTLEQPPDDIPRAPTPEIFKDLDALAPEPPP
jgi:hypothetical protein